MYLTVEWWLNHHHCFSLSAPSHIQMIVGIWSINEILSNLRASIGLCSYHQDHDSLFIVNWPLDAESVGFPSMGPRLSAIVAPKIPPIIPRTVRTLYAM